MQFDLNGDWGEAEVTRLLASVEDDRDWRLEVDRQGRVYLRDQTVPTGLDVDQTLHCFFELWSQGMDYVGPGAASDRKLVAKIAGKLRDNWPALKAGQTLYA